MLTFERAGSRQYSAATTIPQTKRDNNQHQTGLLFICGRSRDVACREGTTKFAEVPANFFDNNHEFCRKICRRACLRASEPGSSTRRRSSFFFFQTPGHGQRFSSASGAKKSTHEKVASSLFSTSLLGRTESRLVQRWVLQCGESKENLGELFGRRFAQRCCSGAAQPSKGKACRW